MCIWDMRPRIEMDMCQIPGFSDISDRLRRDAFLRHTSTGIPEIDVFGSIPGVQKHIQRFLGMIDRAEKTCSALFR